MEKTVKTTSEKNTQNVKFFANVKKLGLVKSTNNGHASIYNHTNLIKWLQSEYPEIAKIDDQKLQLKKARTKIRLNLEVAMETLLKARNKDEKIKVANEINEFYRFIYLVQNYDPQNFCSAKTNDTKKALIKSAVSELVTILGIKK